MIFDADACAETVSIIEAILLGADGACIDIGLTSLLVAVALFIGSVVALRTIAAALVRRIFPSTKSKNVVSENLTDPAPNKELKRMPYESPIRSTGAWGSKPR